MSQLTNQNPLTATSNTFAAILDTVNATAQSVTRTVNLGTSGIDMLERYVNKAKSEQIATYAAEESEFEETLCLKMAMKRAKLQTDLARELAADPDLAKHFTSAYSELKSVLANSNTAPKP